MRRQPLQQLAVALLAAISLPSAIAIETDTNNRTETMRVAVPHMLDPSCPAPTTSVHGECVIGSDVTLTAPLGLASSTRLNCHGHRISAWRTGAGEGLTRAPSIPEVGILVDRSIGVGIRDCVLQDFDFGIVLINNKVPAPRGLAVGPNGRAERIDFRFLRGNEISTNQIFSRFGGIVGLETDKNWITNNLIRIVSGAGILLTRDSSFNRIEDNDIGRSTTDPPLQHPVFPGGDQFAFNNFTPGIQLGSGVKSLINVQIGAVFYQFPVTGRGQGNVIRDNQLNTEIVELNSIQIFVVSMMDDTLVEEKGF